VELIKQKHIRRRTYLSRGRTNLMNHIKTHKNYESEWVVEKSRRDGPSSTSNKMFVFEISDKAKTMHGWLELIINNLPIVTVENVIFRKYCNLGHVSIKTIVKYMELVNDRVKDAINSACAGVERFESEVTIVQIANAEFKRQNLTHEGPLSAYQSMLHVLPTSNISERLNWFFMIVAKI